MKPESPTEHPNSDFDFEWFDMLLSRLLRPKVRLFRLSRVARDFGLPGFCLLAKHRHHPDGESEAEPRDLELGALISQKKIAQREEEDFVSVL